MTLDELAREYGTPLYVYRLDAVRRAVADLTAALPPGVRLYYSVKANPHPVLVRAVADSGVDVEISSPGELAVARSAGVSGDRTLYTGPAKTSAELADAVRAGVRWFSVESLADRSRLAAAADTPVDYLVRLSGRATAAAGLRMTGTASQFGVDADTLGPDPEILRPTGNARPAGFHLFSATMVRDEAALLDELSTNLRTARKVADRTGHRPRVLDLGGGFAAPFATPGRRERYPALRAGLGRELDSAWPGWRDGYPQVAVESGRYLVAEAGILLTTVLDRKYSFGREYVLCDAGVNVLGGMSGLGRLLAPAAQPQDQPESAPPVVLAGPLCTPLDVLARTARVADPAVGDVLAIPNVGAYGLTASLLAFLGRPVAAEVVVDGAAVVDARRLTVTATGI
jgi:diaminopimelate decarboxylase